MKIKIEEAKRKDINHILRLAKEFTNFLHKLDDYYQTWAGGARKYKKWLLRNFSKKNFKTLIAKTDKDGIIAYGIATIQKPRSLTIYIKFKKFGFIEVIYVKEKFRKKGIGRKIFNKFLKWFILHNIKVIELTVHVKNKFGIAAWKKYGFFEHYKGMRKEL